MSTPNNRFETLSTDTLATATGGATYAGGARSTTWGRAGLGPLVHSLRDLNANAQTTANQQNQTLMMGMMAAIAARR